MLRESARNDPLIVFQAGLAMRKFVSEGWVGDIDVPAAVMITERDRVMRKWRQEALHAAIPGAVCYPVDGGHFAPVFGTEFATQLGHAVRDVADRSSRPVRRRRRPAATAKKSRPATTAKRSRPVAAVPGRSLAVA
jgi:hypothetical protein